MLCFLLFCLVFHFCLYTWFAYLVCVYVCLHLFSPLFTLRPRALSQSLGDLESYLVRLSPRSRISIIAFLLSRARMLMTVAYSFTSSLVHSTLHLAVWRCRLAVILRLHDRESPAISHKASQLDFPDNLGSTILLIKRCHLHSTRQQVLQLSRICHMQPFLPLSPGSEPTISIPQTMEHSMTHLRTASITSAGFLSPT